MAKPPPTPVLEAVVIAVRKVAPERYSVVRQVLRGMPVEEKVLERSVTLNIARDSAKTAIKKETERQLAPLGGVLDA